MSLNSASPRAYSIRVYLLLSVLVAVVPVLIFSAVLSNKLIEAEERFSERYLNKTVDELAHAVDQEIIGTVRVLQVLAQVESLRIHDLPRFHRILVRSLQTQPSWTNIVLHNTKAEGILTARDAYGIPYGLVVDSESVNQVVATALPVVGNVVKAVGRNLAFAKSPYRFSVRVPVIGVSEKVEYVLSAVISTDHLLSLVNRFSHNPNEWTRAIIDSGLNISARSRDNDKYVGGPASQTLREYLTTKQNGLEKTVTLEGVPAYTSFRRAPFSGWYAAIAVPSSVLQAQADATKRNVVMIALWIFLLVLAVSVFISRRIRQPIQESSAAAAALARGEIPVVGQSRILEIEQMRQSLFSASELLRSRARAKDEFLANMSHELRTPLGIVLGTTDLLSKDAVPSDEKEKSWEIVKRNGQQLLRLIDDILDLSKMEANKLNLEYIDFSLPDLVAAIGEDFGTRAQDKKIELVVQIKDGGPKIVNSDPLRVRQIISNLVGNAIKFTHEGRITITLHESQTDLQRITVADTGIGLNEIQQSMLFKEFTQGDSSHTRKYGGTGLGLSLSRKLARLLGGDVKLLHSHSGRGSLFEITFVGKSVAGPVDKSAARDVNPDSQSAELKVAKILLAEDSLDNVALIKAYLRDSRVDVRVASNGLEAIDLADKSFDLILMDIQMPGADGYEATREIRKRGYTMPIIALTAHALAEHRKNALAGGFTDFVTKPLQRQTLLDVIEKYI